MMLDAYAKMAQIVSSLAVSGAVIFALIQIRQYRQQRRDAAAVELMRTIQSPQWTRALHLLGDVPDGIAATALHAMDAKYEEAAFTVVAIYETIGLLAYRNIAPFHLVQELTGGTVVVMWRKLKSWSEDMREEREHDRFAEWFQWLAERLEENEEAVHSGPAYRRCSKWKPGR
jgi:hypothetical protein